MFKKAIYSFTLILSIAICLGVLYAAGFVASIQLRDVSPVDHISEQIEGKVEFHDYIVNKDFLLQEWSHPVVMWRAAFKYTHKYVLTVIIIFVLFSIARLWIYVIIYSDYFLLYLQVGGNVIDKKGTYGKAMWIDKTNLKVAIKKKYVALRNGVVLGSLINPNEVKKIDYRKYLITVPENKRFNKHMFVTAPSGDGKSFAFVMTSTINVLRSNRKIPPSFLYTDPKGELYKSLSGIFKDEDYRVYLFNLLSMKNSDRFNALHYIENETDVDVIVDAILKNTKIDDDVKVGGDPFWESAEKSILKAVILYFKFYEKDKTLSLPIVYDFINNSTYQEIDNVFSSISNAEPCRAMYNIYNKAKDELKGNILLGLCSRLNIFIIPQVRRLTEANDINIYDLKIKKTALFIATPDTHDSFNFLAALLHTVIGIKVIEQTEQSKRNVIKQREIIGFYDEIANIGIIPRFEKWVTTFRSRNYTLIPIFQDIHQPKRMFGDQWLSVYGSCHTKVVLGVGDPETAKFISDKLGTQSIRKMNKMKEAGLSKMRKNKQWSQTDDKRNLMNPEELEGMDLDEMIVMRKAMDPIKLYKFGWDNFKKEYEKAQATGISTYDYVPDWWDEREIEKEEVFKIGGSVDQKEAQKEEKKIVQVEEKVFRIKKEVAATKEEYTMNDRKDGIENSKNEDGSDIEDLQENPDLFKV